MPRSKIFLSYRREDSSGYTELLFERLVAHFGKGAVFRDVHSIAPSTPYQEAIGAAIQEAAALVVIIGQNWAAATDAYGGRRLEDVEDVLVYEITLRHDLFKGIVGRHHRRHKGATLSYPGAGVRTRSSHEQRAPEGG